MTFENDYVTLQYQKIQIYSFFVFCYKTDEIKTCLWVTVFALKLPTCIFTVLTGFETFKIAFQS